MEAIAKVPKIPSFSIPNIDLSAFASAHADAMAVFPEIQKQFAAQMQPLADLQKQFANLPAPSDELVKQLDEAAKRFHSIEFNFPRPTPEQMRLFERAAKADQRRQTLEKTGVLPHASTPFRLLDDDDADLRVLLERHYRENWDQISEDILDRSQRFTVDDEAKAALAEALAAHGNGHYRSVCRLLLPEIERVARVELLGNEFGTIHVDKVVGGPALELPINETDLPGFYALSLLAKPYQFSTCAPDVRVRSQNNSRHFFAFLAGQVLTPQRTLHSCPVIIERRPRAAFSFAA